MPSRSAWKRKVYDWPESSPSHSCRVLSFPRGSEAFSEQTLPSRSYDAEILLEGITNDSSVVRPTVNEV